MENRLLLEKQDQAALDEKTSALHRHIKLSQWDCVMVMVDACECVKSIPLAVHFVSESSTVSLWENASNMLSTLADILCPVIFLSLVQSSKSIICQVNC